MAQYVGGLKKFIARVTSSLVKVQHGTPLASDVPGPLWRFHLSARVFLKLEALDESELGFVVREVLDCQMIRIQRMRFRKARQNWNPLKTLSYERRSGMKSF
jgi:hypothetical protein